MEKELVTFQVAKLAKEKGFDWLCNGFYDLYDNPHNNEITYSSPDNWNLYKSLSAPIQSLLARWLREVHNMHVYVTPESISKQNNIYLYHILGDNISLHFKGVLGMNYEEALEEGLYQALKLIK